jgi:hypothetical protein
MGAPGQSISMARVQPEAPALTIESNGGHAQNLIYMDRDNGGVFILWAGYWQDGNRAGTRFIRQDGF